MVRRAVETTSLTLIPWRRISSATSRRRGFSLMDAISLARSYISFERRIISESATRPASPWSCLTLSCQSRDLRISSRKTSVNAWNGVRPYGSASAASPSSASSFFFFLFAPSLVLLLLLLLPSLLPLGPASGCCCWREGVADEKARTGACALAAARTSKAEARACLASLLDAIVARQCGRSCAVEGFERVGPRTAPPAFLPKKAKARRWP